MKTQQDKNLMMQEKDMTCDMEKTLELKSKEELILECERREAIAHKIWAAIMMVYGPDGFTKVLRQLESREVNLTCEST